MEGQYSVFYLSTGLYLCKIHVYPLCSDDFVADIGAVRTDSSMELLYARQKIVAHAKAFGLQAIDLVHINYKDLQGLHNQSIEGANMGFHRGNR